MYPRQLTKREREWLYYLLPEDSSGYSVYRKKIGSMVVIGAARFGEGNFVLGYEGDMPDFSYPSLPMFACGQIEFENSGNPTLSGKIQVSIHELYDNKIEFSISNLLGEAIPEKLTEKKRWSYSYWKPGAMSPFDNDDLREIDLSGVKGKLVLAVSKANKSIWLYDGKTQVNHIIPVTNFINELLRGNKSIDKAKGINIDYVFSNLQQFRDEDFQRALAEYNKHWRKIDLNEFTLPTHTKKKSIFGKLFLRFKNQK